MSSSTGALVLTILGTIVFGIPHVAATRFSYHNLLQHQTCADILLSREEPQNPPSSLLSCPTLFPSTRQITKSSREPQHTYKDVRLFTGRTISLVGVP
jgi:hypothetical protein